MTAHECLIHSWLMGDHSDRSAEINSSCYTKIRDKIRQKYDNWDSVLVPIGRLSEYSSLRKLLIEKYRIHETSFGMFIFRDTKLLPVPNTMHLVSFFFFYSSNIVQCLLFNFYLFYYFILFTENEGNILFQFIYIYWNL